MSDSKYDADSDDLFVSGYAAYYEPLRPPDQLRREASDLMAEARNAASSAKVEELLRAALERHVDAFLVDRHGHSNSYEAAHALGRQIVERFGCPFAFEPERQVWRLRCGVLALHSRVGLSPGGSTLGQCSICDANDFECSHINGEVYGGQRCSRVITQYNVNEVSLVSRPYDPRCYRLDNVVSARSVERQHGGPLAPGEVPVCEHCLACPGSPTEDDLNPDAWDSA